jgi:uncharacterized protein YbjT (DUF2867 family)
MILVTGGTGFLGTPVVEQLVVNQHPVRVFTRGAEDWRTTDGLDHLRQVGVEVFLGDLRDPYRVQKALQDIQVVINLAGIMRSGPDQTYQELHIDALKELVALCEKQKIRRFIHVSCAGATTGSDSEYYRTKAEGEDIVRAGDFHWTVFRPSFMFGNSFVITDILLPMVKKLPVVPVIGGGLAEIQPIFLYDVASCIIQSIFNQQTSGQTYDLVGPASYSVMQIIELMAEQLGSKKPVVTVPSEASMKFVKLVEKVYPKGLFSEDLAKLLMTDSTGNATAMRETFKVTDSNFEEKLSSLITK